MEKRNYYVVDMMHVEGIDETPKTLYVVDCVHKKILYYNMAHDCKDVTASTRKIYNTDKDKLYMNRRLGCGLIELMEHLPYKGMAKEILLATDSAREVTRKVAGIRAEWHTRHARALERTAASESAGWGESVDDDFIAEQFKDL